MSRPQGAAVAWSIRRPWLAIGIWLGFVVFAVALGGLTGTKTLSNGAVGESARGYTVMDRERPVGPAARARVPPLRHRAGRDPPFAAAIRDVRRRFEAMGSQRGRRPRATGAPRSSSPRSTRPSRSSGSRRRSRPQRGRTRGIEHRGDRRPLRRRAARHIVDGDLHRAELLAIPVTLVVLLIAFGSLVAALVPLLLGLSAVAAGLGLLGPLSQASSRPGQREDRDPADRPRGRRRLCALLRRPRAGGAPARHGPRGALETTAGMSGRTVLVSGITVAVAMAGMFLIGRQGAERHRCGHDRGRRLRGGGLDHRSAGRARAFSARGSSGAESRFCRRSCGPAAAASGRRSPSRPPPSRSRGLPLCPACSSRSPSRRSRSTSRSRATSPSPRRMRRRSARSPPSVGRSRSPASRRSSPLRVPVSSSDAAAAQLRRLRSLALRSGLAHLPAAIRATADRTAAALELPLAGNGANRASRHAIDTLRRTLVPKTVGHVPGAKVAVTGQTAEDLDFTQPDPLEPPLRDRLRALARVLRAARRVPVARRSRQGGCAQPALGRRRLRCARARLRAPLGGADPGLPLERDDRRLAAALPLRRPVRPLDGLPRVCLEPRPRGGRPGRIRPSRRFGESIGATAGVVTARCTRDGLRVLARSGRSRRST